MTEEAANAPEQQFQLQRIYIKDLSFEAPKCVEQFQAQWKPDVNLEVQTANKMVAENVYEVVVKITVTVKNAEETAFICEIDQAGLFLLQGVEGLQKEAILKGVCANILFPYARETISELVSKGTFPQFLLQPINFEAAFAENVRKQQAEAQNNGGQPNTH